jgi:molecular chaperone HtpG
MQDTALIQKLNKVLTSRFLKFLDDTAEKDPALYEKFYAEYQRFLKEGVVTDFTHKEALGKLLRYESSTTEAGKLTSLAEYVKRMPSDQKEIYYVMAPNRAAAEASPYFEVFRERKFEVLFLYDAWDEFVMEHLRDFEGKPLKGAEKADINLAEKQSGALSEEAAKALATWLKETLSERVGEVRASQRLVDSPCGDRTGSARASLRGPTPAGHACSRTSAASRGWPRPCRTGCRSPGSGSPRAQECARRAWEAGDSGYPTA